MTEKHKGQLSSAGLFYVQWHTGTKWHKSGTQQNANFPPQEARL